MKRIEIQVFCDDVDTLKTKIYALKDLLPQNTKVIINESLIPYAPDTDYLNCSASEILKEEIARLNDNRSYRRRTVSVEGKMEEAEFIKIFENAGFQSFGESIVEF